jgi:hypothetical protein
MLDKTNGLETNDEPQPRSVARKKPPKPIQHRWFDQWLIARGEPLKQLVREVAQIVESRERRERARRPDDERSHRRMVEGKPRVQYRRIVKTQNRCALVRSLRRAACLRT